MPGPLIDAAEWALRLAGPVTPVLAAMVRKNMQSAGVYSPKALRSYFHNAGNHLANGVRIFHHRRKPDAIRRIAHREVELDASIGAARDVIRVRGGGILAPAHCTNYLISLVRLNEEIPITIYLRWSKDQRKIDLKRAWCEAAGLDVILEPRDAANPIGSAMICAEAIRAGKVLAITPDLARKCGDGTPVSVLDRRAFLPTGPASLALLCNVPMIPLFARYQGSEQILYAETPIDVGTLSRAEGGRQESVRRAMQTWVDGFSRFIRQTPQGWFLWADNRWTRVFQGDPEYSAPPSDSSPKRDDRTPGAKGAMSKP